MTTFSTTVDGKLVTIVVKERFNPYGSEYVQEFMLKENGSWKEITAGQAFSMLRKALEQGNTIEYAHSYYDAYADDYVVTIEPIQTLDELLEVWYV